jgi:hypothetical protein
MFTKFLIAVLAIVLGWVLLRYLSQPRPSPKAKVVKRKPGPKGEEVTTLERDPETGVYR